MKLETKINRIKELSAKKEPENWGFRSFLKSCEIPEKTIDSIVHRLNQEISTQIDCRECSNCCKEMDIVLNPGDVDKMAEALNMSAGEFEERYLIKDHESDKYVIGTHPCPMLENNLCTIYSSRPSACRSYPHLHKKSFSSRTIGVIGNCSVCPIVYNVYEHLKKEIWAADDGDDIDEVIDVDELDEL